MAEEEFTGYRLKSREYNRITIAMFMAAIVTFSILYAPQPLMPDFTREFNVPPATAALSLSFTTLGLSFALIVAGPLTEVFGRRLIILISLFTSSTLSILGSFIPNWELLLASRLFIGISLAGLPAAAIAYLSDELHPNAQGPAAGLYIGGTAVGSMIGRMLTGFMASHFGWHFAMVFTGVTGLIVSFAVMWMLPKQRGFHRADGIMKYLWNSTRGIITDKGFIALFGIGTCLIGSFVGVFNMMSYRLQESPYLLPVWAIGLIFLVYAPGGWSSATAGKMVARYGQRTVAPFGMIIMFTGLLITLMGPLWVIITGLVIFSIGFFAAHGVAAGWVAARARAGVGATGQASSAYSVFYYMGSSVFGSVSGMAWSWGHWPAVTLLCGSLIGIAFLLALWLRHIPSLGEPRLQPE